MLKTGNILHYSPTLYYFHEYNFLVGHVTPKRITEYTDTMCECDSKQSADYHYLYPRVYVPRVYIT